ncbi:MAG: hypothetical protein KBT15_07450 [Bacteroidales bacterium]|nr:hypothetical protein [Candidatus Minthousia equi]
MLDFGNISLPDLLRFQEDIYDLSDALRRAHEKIEEGLLVASHSWQDTKYDEFYTSFKNYSEELENISKSYRKWADGHLQDTVKVVLRHHGFGPGN